jgi:LPS O-antigen subunit length determinant protein (WzzB/FepE family)
MNSNSFLNTSQNQEVKLFDLIRIILDKKYKIILFTFLITIATFFISIQLTPIYKSDALLEVITDNDNDIPDLGAYGGLAAMAGVDIGSQEDKAFLIEETVKSRLFLSHLISIEIYMQLMAMILYLKK